MTGRTFTLLSLAALTVVVMRCSSNVAGGSTTTDNAKVACAIVNPDGSPAAGVSVRVRPADYVTAVPSPLAKASRALLDTISDAQGMVLMANLDSGEYCIEANNGATGAGLARVHLD